MKFEENLTPAQTFGEKVKEYIQQIRFINEDLLKYKSDHDQTHLNNRKVKIQHKLDALVADAMQKQDVSFFVEAKNYIENRYYTNDETRASYRKYNVDETVINSIVDDHEKAFELLAKCVDEKLDFLAKHANAKKVMEAYDKISEKNKDAIAQLHQEGKKSNGIELVDEIAGLRLRSVVKKILDNTKDAIIFEQAAVATAAIGVPALNDGEIKLAIATAHNISEKIFNSQDDAEKQAMNIYKQTMHDVKKINNHTKRLKKAQV